MMRRRRLLQALALGAMAPSCPALRAAGAPRLAPLDWQIAEILLGLGFTPLAIPSLAMYRTRVPEPPLPEGVYDLGASWEPNLELLQRLRPERILLSQVQALSADLYRRIAPVEVLAFDARVAPLQRGFDDIAQVAGWLDCAAVGAALRQRTEARLARVRQQVTRCAHRPIYLADIDQGGSHVRLWGERSLLGDTLQRVGLHNAWQGPVGPAGWALVELQDLLEQRDARLLYLNFGKASQRSLAGLRQSTLWQALPLVRAGRVSPIPPTYVFGGAQTAARFAELLARDLPPENEVCHA